MARKYCHICGKNQEVKITFKGLWEEWFCKVCGKFLGSYKTR